AVVRVFVSLSPPPRSSAGSVPESDQPPLRIATPPSQLTACHVPGPSLAAHFDVHGTYRRTSRFRPAENDAVTGKPCEVVPTKAVLSCASKFFVPVSQVSTCFP